MPATLRVPGGFLFYKVKRVRLRGLYSADKKIICIALGLLTAFALWTIAIRLIDVRPIGPQGSAVGFATAVLKHKSDSLRAATTFRFCILRFTPLLHHLLFRGLN